MESYEKHVERTLNAVHMQPVDKIPYSYSGPAYLALRQGLTLAEYVGDYKAAARASAQFCLEHPGVDSIHSPAMCLETLGILWLSKVAVPGKGLPDNEVWQLLEAQRMTEDDYRKIIDQGYPKWLYGYLKDIGIAPTKVLPWVMAQKGIAKTMRNVGIPVMNGASTGGPIEYFCGGRGLMDFCVDVYDEPELVKSSMDVAYKFMKGVFEMQLKSKPFGAWVGGWRAAPSMIGHDIFMEFAWPYLKDLVNTTIAAGAIPVLHFDACWDSELETLRELPERKCILMFDSFTDMRKAREILDERMCFLGDVPASMLAFGTADEVYEYCVKLIDDVGPKTGLILSSGCDCPPNAKHENVDAMIQATLDYRV